MSERVMHTLAIGCPMRWPRMECGMPASEGGSQDFVTSRGAVTCPGCKAAVDKDPIEAFGEPPEMRAYAEWARGGDSGLSSKCILSAITGVSFFEVSWRRNGECFVPHDCWDFGRCHRLLQLFPELRAQLHMATVKHPQWATFVGAWSKLEAIYERVGDAWSEEMQEILQECGS